MLVSTYHLDDTERARARRIRVDARPAIVGRGRACHVVVDDAQVVEQHVQLSLRDGGVVVEPLRGVVLVEGRPIDGPTVVPPGAAIRIGDTIVKVRPQASPVVTTEDAGMPATRVLSDRQRPMPVGNPPRPMPTWNPPAPAPEPPATAPPPLRLPRVRKVVLSSDPAEQDFLTTLRARPADSATRMVFGDWLEQRGDIAKAELARLTEYLDTDRHRRSSTIEWRAVVVRTPIEQCGKAGCPARWDLLSPSKVDDFARRCHVCTQRVSFCGELDEVRASARAAEPVVFDVSLDRVGAHGAYRAVVGEPPVSTFDDEDDSALDTPIDTPLDPIEPLER